MNGKDKITGLIDRLGSYSPDPENREEMISTVMSSTATDERLTLADHAASLLFWWTDILWIKRSLATVSLLLVFVFVAQQFKIVNRIGRLENRMVESNTEQLIRQQGEYVMLKAMLRQEVGESDLRDSIMVADKDLRELINSYNELEKRYKELKHEYYSQKFNGNINKQKL